MTALPVPSSSLARSKIERRHVDPPGNASKSDTPGAARGIKQQTFHSSCIKNGCALACFCLSNASSRRTEAVLCLQNRYRERKGFTRGFFTCSRLQNQLFLTSAIHFFPRQSQDVRPHRSIPGRRHKLPQAHARLASCRKKKQRPRAKSILTMLTTPSVCF